MSQESILVIDIAAIAAEEVFLASGELMGVVVVGTGGILRHLGAVLRDLGGPISGFVESQEPNWKLLRRILEECLSTLNGELQRV